MKNYSIVFGIDVSKSTIDVVGINLSGAIIFKHRAIENSKKSIQLLVKKITHKYGVNNVVFAFENTGIYSLHLAYVLNYLDTTYYNLSALEIHRSMGISRGKSDKIDALVIAKYVLSNDYKIQPSSFTQENIITLQYLYTQRDKIVKAIKCFNNNKELESFLPKKSMSTISKTTTSIIKNLKRNLQKVEQAILELINDDQQLKEDYNLCLSVPGIGPQTATYLLIVTKGFTCFNNARQLACYGGVAPFPYQSGSSIRGRNKVNHMADKKLKSLLNMCALNAKKYDYQLKLYFDKKIDEGKNKMLVLNNIRNKILHRVFAVVRRKTPYVNTCAFGS